MWLIATDNWMDELTDRQTFSEFIESLAGKLFWAPCRRQQFKFVNGNIFRRKGKKKNYDGATSMPRKLLWQIREIRVKLGCVPFATPGAIWNYALWIISVLSYFFFWRHLKLCAVDHISVIIFLLLAPSEIMHRGSYQSYHISSFGVNYTLWFMTSETICLTLP